MVFTEQLAEKVQYRIAIVLPRSKMVLAERHGETLRLPRVEILRWARPAEQLARAIRERWNLPSIVIDRLPAQSDLPPCAVVEVCMPGVRKVPDGLISDDLDAIAAESELTRTERAVLGEILSGNTRGRGPFSRIGWLEEAQEWIRESVPHHSVEFTEDIRQLNASATFALVRFGTKQGPAYWLKATGAPNLHEFGITTALTECFPQFLPPLVAAREDWNAWVTTDAGQPLRDCLTLPALEQAVLALAQLQKESTRCIKQLVAAGVVRRGIPVLQSKLNDLIDYLEEAMEQQTSTKVPRLEPPQLRELGRILHDACCEMQELGIPDALTPLDINPGNVLFDGSQCVFIDWAEAYIGNPFLTFEQLRVHVERAGEPASSWVPRLRAVYTRSWFDLISEPKIDRAFVLAPLLAVATYLYGRGDWLHTPRRDDPALQSYARSLGRHMYRAARATELMAPSCR
jgi:hypothetical protein